VTTRRVADPMIVTQIKDEVRRLRREGQVPIELRLDQTRWNAVSPDMRQGPWGGRTTTLFDGLPCALSIGVKDPRGFLVRTVQPKG
jgi:hypothetical protein